MDSNTYYFPNLAEDDDLSKLAAKAKEMMQQNNNVVQIFKLNNEMLFGQSPKQTLFLMKLNKQSLFSPPSSNENSPSKRKSYEEKLTPTKCTPGTSNMPRRRLPFDDAEKKEQRPATIDFSTPTGRRKTIVHPTVEAISNSSVDKPGISVASQISSPTTEIARMTTNLTKTERDFESPVKLHGRTDASSQESSPTTEITRMTSNLTMAEKDLESPVKSNGRIDARNQESSPTTETARMTTNLTMDEKNFESPVKLHGRPDESSQESSPTTEIARMTKNLTISEKELSPVNKVGNIKAGIQEDHKGSRKLIKDDQQAGNSTTNKDSPNPKENASKSQNLDSPNKYVISHAERMDTSEPDLISSETLSPAKRIRICSISPSDIKECFSPSKKGRMEENSPEVTVSPIGGTKLNRSPIESIKGIPRDDRKRKSLSPTRRITTPFKTVPRVIKMECEEEMRVEVVDLEYGASPTTSRSKSADYRRDSSKDSSIKSQVVGETKLDTSPKTPERCLRPSERAIARGSSHNASGTNSPGSSSDLDNSSTDIKFNPTLLKVTIQKFNSLLAVRDGSMKNSLLSFQCLQTGISYTKNYVLSAVQTLLMIDLSGKCSTEEFKTTVRDANAISDKLLNKLKSWEKDIDLNIYACQKCFQKIEQLQAKYEPLFTKEGEPAVTFETMQVYEGQMRALWKEMDGMIMLGDSRRVLFAHIARDVERLIKMLVKCLILVGILQTR